MEDVLAKILKDSSPVKHGALRTSCLEMRELLANQHELIRAPPYEVRGKCLEALQLSLETKHSKLVGHALSGLQRLVWDKNFQSVFETNDDETWLPCQLLQSVVSISSQHDDVQVEILKILVQMTNTCSYSLSTKAVIHLISLCLEVYSKGSASLRAAAQATASQTLQVFCLVLQEPDVENEGSDQEELKQEDKNYSLVDGVMEDLSPVLTFICGKLKNFSVNGKVIIPLLLQCILSIFRNLSVDVHQSATFLSFLWQELCPLLVALLGSPKTDKNIVSSQKSNSGEGNEIGRGSGCLAVAPSCQSVEAKAIFSIAVELVRLIGNVGSLRPVLESLFHRMLLYPPPQHRLEALRAVREIMKSPELVLKLAGPPSHDDSDKASRSEDLDLIRIVMDSLGECCHSSDQNTCYASVSCASDLLTSLEEICNGFRISDDYVKEINSLFKTLTSADYKGVKSDRWRETRRLPASVIQNIASNLSSEYSDSALSGDENGVPEELDCYIEEEVISPETKIIHNENFGGLNEEVNEDNTDLGRSGSAQSLQSSHEKLIDEVQGKLSQPESVQPSQDSPKVVLSEGQREHATTENVQSQQHSIEQEHVESYTELKVSECTQDAQHEQIEHHDDHLRSESTQLHYHSCEAETNADFPLDERAVDGADVEDDALSSSGSVHDALEIIASSSMSEPISGPPLDETVENLSDESEDCERELADMEAADRLTKVPRTLLGQEDAGKLERERVEQLCIARMEFAQQERQTARNFMNELCKFMPKLLSIRSSVQADQELQEFASNYCEGLWQHQQTMNEVSEEEALSQITILNADGTYLAMYSALLLNLKLIRSNYYNDSSVPVPLTEQQFIEEVHGSGVLVYLSATWLAELYQQVLSVNFLEEAGYSPNSLKNSALVNLLSGLQLGVAVVENMWNLVLSDVDGFGNSQQGGQQLADYRRLEQAVMNKQSSPSAEAGQKFVRRILTCSWETILEVLSVLLNGTNSCGITSTIGFLLGTEGAREEHRKARDAIAESIDGLQRAAKLCSSLGLQTCCGAVFAQLAATSCPLSDESSLPSTSSAKRGKRKHLRSLLPLRNRPLRLHTSHVFSMDVMLSRGLELGSHSPSCWTYVFQCCLYVLELENVYFSNCSGIRSVLKRPALQALKKAVEKKCSRNGDVSGTADVEENFHELLPGSSIPEKLNIFEMVRKNSEAHTSGVVKDQLLLEVIEGLSLLVDRLFEEAASKLNLSALIGFLVELCATSQIQLFTQSYHLCAPMSSHGNNLLLYHLGDIMLRCARGGRPLIHVMKAWSVVAPHFVEAACHKDRMISKRAVTIIHDVVSALLSSSAELPHFHFNEALFKPFENLLCLELCDTDVQEQIICSMCEFVEGCTMDIRSGWRPLFGALRAVRLPSITSPVPSIETEKEHADHLRVILDVFEAFLGTNNILVFAYAAIDCLLCLLKHVKGPAEIQDALLEQTGTISEDTVVPLDLCLAALKYLERCNSILASMYNMPACPVFNSANRIQLHSVPNTVDHMVSGLDIVHFNEQLSASESVADKGCLQVGDNLQESATNDFSDSLIPLKSLDKKTGILHVWFLLLEGLAGAIVTCPKKYQPHTLETLFCMLRNLKDITGPDFGIYCINHVLLPLLQSWLRRTARMTKEWTSFAANFKQCCGLTTDLVVDYIQYVAGSSNNSLAYPGINLIVYQLFLVLAECIAQSSETISRLGCACIRHVIMSAGKHFTSDLWDITCNSLQRACRITLQSVKQLMVCFHADSDNFYGDLGEVKVAAKKDCTLPEAERLKQLARQVFLLDCQRVSRRVAGNVSEDDKRSYTFLLHPPQQEVTTESDVIRVPFRDLLVRLLSHQILLQTLCTVLLHGTNHISGNIVTFLSFLSLEDTTNLSEHKLPGFLSKLTSKQLHILLSCLEDSYKTACDFDSRPGLKFLVQKVAQIDVAANLYKQAGVSWSTYVLTIFELCLSDKNLKMEDVNKYLSQIGADDSSKSLEAESLADAGRSEFYITLLKKFKDICELYTECAMDKDGMLATVDRMSDQPIFFLVAPHDSISDFTSDGKKINEDQTLIESNELQSCDSSDSEDLAIENDSKGRVYSLATERTIHSLLNEYKKRKIRHSMPSAFREKLQKKSISEESKSSTCDGSLPEEIILQRRTSITKDGEAHVLVFKQLVQTVLDLHLSLPEHHFQAFLPVFFPGFQYLVAYATDADVKLTAAEWLQQLACCCGFGSTLRSSAP